MCLIHTCVNMYNRCLRIGLYIFYNRETNIIITVSRLSITGHLLTIKQLIGGDLYTDCLAH